MSFGHGSTLVALSRCRTRPCARRRVLLGRSGGARPDRRHGAVWDEQVAAAYRESFEEFTREHPDIEVRINVVAYRTYFDTLRTDVAGGSADDIFWLSNAYFAGYADSGRLMTSQRHWERSQPAWEPSVVDQFTRNGTCGRCRN